MDQMAECRNGMCCKKCGGAGCKACQGGGKGEGDGDGLVATLNQTDFWADDVWQRSVVAARNTDLFQAWHAWIAAAK